MDGRVSVQSLRLRWDEIIWSAVRTTKSMRQLFHVRLGKFTKNRKNRRLRVVYHDILTPKKKMGFTTLLIQRCGRCLLHRQVRFLFPSDHVFIYSDTLRLFMSIVNWNLAGVMQCCFVVYGVWTVVGVNEVLWYNHFVFIWPKKSRIKESVKTDSSMFFPIIWQGTVTEYSSAP